MINWLIQSLTAHPYLARDLPPPGLLSQKEQETFQALKSKKRQRDWLLGRCTAKHLVQATVGHDIPLLEIEIGNKANGAPIVNFPLPMSNDQSPVSLSISHSHGTAFCVLLQRPFWPIGCDIELIESRAQSFVSDYFTVAEKAMVEKAGEQRDQLVTIIWSAKEAALKALELGLNADTRAIECLQKPLPATGKWQSFTVNNYINNIMLTGWYRVINPFVLTIVAKPV